LSIDFDLPGASGGTVQSFAQPGPAAASGSIDFDLGFAAGGAQAEAPKAPEIGLSAISLDLGTPGGGNGSGGVPDARWQEVATKLDLAKAYEEMGDKDGARELLNEVVKEGDAAQQQQAQTRLQTLG
jgi:pilus assembly protein FimV